ncbi:NUDIX hydrolase [Sphingobium amiense]|uniref:NUDIX hydrolase n=1 Tax=Sphingobium amiense TaxID=135719 RepID=A0A494WA20_9SPHN|nr:NUDIX domain-containing protein [Sphingobium amiense]BBD97039.1 NUDIX hydrolase [Sphingobium amiense]
MAAQKEDAPGRPAATLVILRDRAGAPPDLLMVERAASMAFAPSALVFPGGAVDEDDAVLASRFHDGIDAEDAAARVAAIRETVEEAGLGVGIEGADAATVLRLRDGLHDGKLFSGLLARHDLKLDLAALTPFARWHPAPFDEARRVFDARFYLACAPLGQVASVDTTENVRLLWAAASEVIDQCDRGEGRIIYPTRRNLERLALFSSFAQAVDHAAAFPVEKIRPWREERDGVVHLCIPDHLGYPVTAEPMAQVQRA